MVLEDKLSGAYGRHPDPHSQPTHMLLPAFLHLLSLHGALQLLRSQQGEPCSACHVMSLMHTCMYSLHGTCPCCARCCGDGALVGGSLGGVWMLNQVVPQQGPSITHIPPAVSMNNNTRTPFHAPDVARCACMVLPCVHLHTHMNPRVSSCHQRLCIPNSIWTIVLHIGLAECMQVSRCDAPGKGIELRSTCSSPRHRYPRCPTHPVYIPAGAASSAPQAAVPLQMELPGQKVADAFGRMSRLVGVFCTHEKTCTYRERSACGSICPCPRIMTPKH
jgi:hypothetical protein